MTMFPQPDAGSMNFAELRRSGCCYVDKTMHISGLLGPARGPLLLTRPRRFGKTLTQSTLQSFLQLNFEHPGSPNADAELFSDLAVSRDTELCAQYQGQFPVIFITFKDVQYTAFAEAYNELCGRVEALCREFAFLADAPQLSVFQREDLTALQRLGSFDNTDDRRFQLLTSSLLLLAQCLYTVYGRPAYILIDEYDVPLLKAAASCSAGDHSYYERLRDITCSLLGKVVKTADHAVRRCLLTSCLHLTLPGRFSGLNNLLVLGMDDQRCAALMGFTQAEVDNLLSGCGLSECREAVCRWYDGYVCGSTRLYNPWSVLNYCACLQADPEAEPRNYWAETSSDDFRPFFLNELSAATISRLQCLLDGGSIPLRVRRAIGYPELEAEACDDQAFFTLLYYAGYLTRAGSESELRSEFVIPNCEVLDSFRLRIYDYFKQSAVRTNPFFRTFIEDLLAGNPAAVEDDLNWLYTHYLDMQAAAGRLRQRRGVGASAGETQYEADLQQQVEEHRGRGRELGYQALTQGVLALFDRSAISALRMEHTLGTGRADISFEGREAGAGTACLLEFKIAGGERDASLERAAEKALAQTRNNGCAAALLEGNPALENVYSYGIGCRFKSCRVRIEVVRRG